MSQARKVKTAKVIILISKSYRRDKLEIKNLKRKVEVMKEKISKLILSQKLKIEEVRKLNNIMKRMTLKSK